MALTSEEVWRRTTQTLTKLRPAGWLLLPLFVAASLLLASCGSTDEEGAGDATVDDLDSDGILDEDDDDIDGDGFSNEIEQGRDSDDDGTPDDRDRDSDNDGLPDIDEAAGDSDGDGNPDRTDGDSDNDGVADSIDEAPTDPNIGEAEDNKDNEDNEEGATDEGSDADDLDKDGIGSDEDNCPEAPNNGQNDEYTTSEVRDQRFGPNGVGDACEDSDGDGMHDNEDKCPVDTGFFVPPCNNAADEQTCGPLFNSGGSPDLIPTTFLLPGGSGSYAQTAVAYEMVGLTAGSFAVCIPTPVALGDGNPIMDCDGLVVIGFPGGEPFGRTEDSIYLTMQVPGGSLPGSIEVDGTNCPEEPTLPVVNDPTIQELGIWTAELHPELIYVPNPATTTPTEVAALPEFSRAKLVDQELYALTLEQMAAVGDSVLIAEVEPEEATGLAPEILVKLPVAVLERVETFDLAIALDNDFSQLPTEYFGLLGDSDLQSLEIEVIESFEGAQVAELDASGQLYVTDQLDQGNP